MIIVHRPASRLMPFVLFLGVFAAAAAAAEGAARLSDPAATAPAEVFPEFGGDTEIERATRLFRSSGEAPPIHRSTSSVFPFGESHPLVRCSPLRACDIELQAGEVVRGVALGDADRWIAKPLLSGAPESSVPHVIVKPTAHGLDTNLVIGTTRRTYHLRLVSPPADAEAGAASDQRHVAFYYPNDLVATWATSEQLGRQQQARRQSATVAALAAGSLDQLNFDYAVKSRRRVSWAPVTVFDDGRQVYLQLPAAARSQDLPALLVAGEDGELGLSNYRVQGLWYIVDGLFSRAELVVGVGKDRRKVEILNRRLSPSRSSHHAD